MKKIFSRPKKPLTFLRFNPQLTKSPSSANEESVSLFEIQRTFFQYPSLSGFEFRPKDLTIEKGDLVGFLGPNGAGKSTLLKLMAGLLSPTQGRILFEGRGLDSMKARERAKNIAYVPQSTQFAFPLNVLDVVEMGRHPYLGRFESMGKEDRRLCERALDLCDALELQDRSYDELSGGEKQRVLLASALAQTPRVLLLDEPTLSLDLSHQLLLFKIIRKLHREEDLTVVVATHELNLAGEFLDRLVLMKEGRIAADGTPRKILTPRNIRSVLGVAVDRLGRKKGLPYFAPSRKEARI